MNDCSLAVWPSGSNKTRWRLDELTGQNAVWLTRRPQKSYSATYRLMQKAIEEGLNKDYSWLIVAQLLLRLHGQELCKRTQPECGKCPLATDCEFHLRGDA